MPVISVIMPVYNSEKYLPMAIESILNQTFSDFELICIDDGSTDTSGHICDNYAKKDPRVRVVHQLNGGISAARNCGLALATGDYIAFMDNDDECARHLLESNYKIAIENNADIVKSAKESIDIHNGVKGSPSSVKLCARVYNRTDIIRCFFDLRLQCVFSTVWEGLYRRSILVENNITFHSQLRFGEEDTIFCFDFLRASNILAVNPEVLFTHYMRYGHSTSTKFHQGALDKHKYSAAVEYELWEQFKILDEDNLKRVICIITMHVLPVLFLLVHPDCKWSFAQKVNFLKQLSEHPYFKYHLTRTEYMNLSHLSKKYPIIAFLFAKEHYRSCLWLAIIQKQLHD